MSNEICRTLARGECAQSGAEVAGGAAGEAEGGMRLTCRAWLLSCRMNSTSMPRSGGTSSCQSNAWNSRRWLVEVRMTPLSMDSLKTSIWPLMVSFLFVVECISFLLKTEMYKRL